MSQSTLSAADVRAMMEDDDSEAPPPPSAKPVKKPASAKAPPPKGRGSSATKKAAPKEAPKDAEDIKALFLEDDSNANNNNNNINVNVNNNSSRSNNNNNPRVATVPKEKEERLTSDDVRMMLESPDQESVVERYEPIKSFGEKPSLGRGAAAIQRGGAVAKGAGFASVLILGTEERAENFESTARTFVAYMIEVQRDDGTGPYLIYRRFKQFYQLHGKCKSHGMHPSNLPPKRSNAWFGFGAIDPNVVMERIPKLQEWLSSVLSSTGAVGFQPLQEWLSPYQIGDLKPQEYRSSQ